MLCTNNYSQIYGKTSQTKTHFLYILFLPKNVKALKKENRFTKETVVGHIGLDCEAVEDPNGSEKRESP